MRSRTSSSLFVLTELEEDQDVSPQGGALHGDLGQGVHRRAADEGVLEDQPVVDEADVLRGLRRAGDLLPEEAQGAGAEVRVLAVLDELTKVQKADLAGRGHLGDDED